MRELDPRLRVILEDSFYIRTTMIRRRSGGPRTVETTYYWNGDDEVVLSGYPGPRDWVANINANPTVTLHTAEFRALVRHSRPGRGPVGHQRTPALSAELHWPVDGEAGIPAPPVRAGSRGDQDQPKAQNAVVGAVLVYPKNLRPDAMRRGHVCRRSNAPDGRAAGPVGAARGPSLRGCPKKSTTGRSAIECHSERSEESTPDQSASPLPRRSGLDPEFRGAGTREYLGQITSSTGSRRQRLPLLLVVACRSWLRIYWSLSETSPGSNFESRAKRVKRETGAPPNHVPGGCGHCCRRYGIDWQYPACRRFKLPGCRRSIRDSRALQPRPRTAVAPGACRN